MVYIEKHLCVLYSHFFISLSSLCERTDAAIVVSVRDTYPCSFAFASVAQLVERLICNQQAAGSSPVGGSIFYKKGCAYHQTNHQRRI